MLFSVSDNQKQKNMILEVLIMENNIIKWTEKSILTGKTLFVILLTLAFNSVLFWLGERLLFLMTPNRALRTAIMWVFCAVSLVPSAFLSVKALKYFCNKKLERMEENVAAEYLRRESKFKWHLLFTVGLCWLAMMVIAAVWLAVIKRMDLTASDSPVPTALLIAVAVMILAFVLLVIGAKKLNRHMIQVTATNAELIDEVYYGLHDDKIPNGVTRSDIIGVLYNAAAYSVTTAAAIHVLVTALKKIGKLFLKLLGISALLGVVLGLLGGNSMDRLATDIVQGNKAAMDAADRDNKAHAAWMDAKDEAKKKAQFSYRQAQKAYDYNPNSYDAYRKKNLFKNDYWAYKDIEKNRP